LNATDFIAQTIVEKWRPFVQVVVATRQAEGMFPRFTQVRGELPEDDADNTIFLKLDSYGPSFTGKPLVKRMIAQVVRPSARPYAKVIFLSGRKGIFVPLKPDMPVPELNSSDELYLRLEEDKSAS